RPRSEHRVEEPRDGAAGRSQRRELEGPRGEQVRPPHRAGRQPGEGSRSQLWRNGEAVADVAQGGRGGRGGGGGGGGGGVVKPLRMSRRRAPPTGVSTVSMSVVTPAAAARLTRSRLAARSRH